MNNVRNRSALRAALTLGSLCLLGGLAAAPAHAQKKLAFEYTGSVSSSIVAAPHVIPDVYSFEATAGQSFVFSTSNTSLDTTIRVVGPHAKLDLFNDDRDLAASDYTSYLELEAPVAGTYIVIVSTYWGAATPGDYALNFERRPCDPASCNARTLAAPPTKGSDP